MAVIVSDTSPLNVLIRLGQVEVLRKLFDRVILPPAVLSEMQHARAPAEVRAFASALPDWIAVQSPVSLLSLSRLDAGEIAAISLALELGAAVLIDERAGRDAARAAGLDVIGAIGVLERAAEVGWIADLAQVYLQVRALNHHIDERILDASLKRHLSRRRPEP
jgi:predicted nucleic acid-binding protein